FLQNTEGPLSVTLLRVRKVRVDSPVLGAVEGVQILPRHPRVGVDQPAPAANHRSAVQDSAVFIPHYHRTQKTGAFALGLVPKNFIFIGAAQVAGYVFHNTPSPSLLNARSR